MKITGIVFDLGNTIIEQRVDSDVPLDAMELKLLPDAKEVIAELSSLFKMGLLSNTTQTSAVGVRVALERLSIGRYFQHVVTSFDVGREKPDASMFLSILRALETLPGETLMVGNDFLQDIEGASACGMRTAYLVLGGSGAGHRADIVFGALRDLPELIRELNAKEAADV